MAEHRGRRGPARFRPSRQASPSGRDWGGPERFAEVGQNLPDRPWLRDERDQPDVAATGWAFGGKLFPTRAMSLAHAIRELSCEQLF